MTLEHSLGLGKAFGMLFEPEIRALSNIVKQLPPQSTIVNIGAGTGTSALTVLETRQDVSLWSIDMRQSSPFGGLQNELNAFSNAGIKYTGNQILGMSEDVAITWGRTGARKIDLLIIDAGHLYNEITTDMRSWLPYMNHNGVVLFHDYERDVWPDVKKAVDKFMSPYKQLGRAETYIWFQFDIHAPRPWENIDAER